jgi:EAL and modified HD-GYP domain-containing signal transduction protein
VGPTVVAGTDHSRGAERTHAATTVHRMPVVAMDGRIIGYSVTVEHGMPDGLAIAEALYQDLDLANLVADRYAFLPATPAMLDGFVPTPVAPGRLVLDLPRGYEQTHDAVPRAGALRGLGMALCLTGFRGTPNQVALLPFLTFAVVDAADPTLATLVHQAHAAGVRVLAARVDSTVDEDLCRAAGIDGIRLGPTSHDVGEIPTQRTPSAPGRVLRAGEMQCLAIMHLLVQPEVAVSDVAQVIETDPVLTLRVLHLVNSGAYALVEQVDTVRQAVVLLGPKEVWTLVAALALDSRPDAMDRLWVILARAMACEVLADDPAGYTVGMLSALAAQLGVPVDALLATVGVSDLVAEAIRAEAGPLGAVLRAVRAHEHSHTAGVLATGRSPGVVSEVYLGCLRDALAIARTATRDPGV